MGFTCLQPMPERANSKEEGKGFLPRVGGVDSNLQLWDFNVSLSNDRGSALVFNLGFPLGDPELRK